MSACSKAELTVDVYGWRQRKQVRRLLTDLLQRGFYPSVMFSIGWRCRELVAMEYGSGRFFYAVMDGAGRIAQWSHVPEILSARTKTKARAAIAAHLAENLKPPLQVSYPAPQ